MITGLLLVAALTGLAIGVIVGGRSPRAWLASTITALTAGFAASFGVLAGGGTWDWRSAARLGGETLHLRLDGISALFLALLCVVAAAGAVFSSEYWTDAAHPRTASTGRRWWNLTVLGLGWVLLVSNGIHFLLGWEAFTLSTYFLMTLERTSGEVRRAGWL
ncbi:MAG: proton-conducting transporter membrane subunit, partial [Gemmatimonadaceae bacterium]